MKIQDYALADKALIDYALEMSLKQRDLLQEELRIMVFKPELMAVVLGQSNSLISSINQSSCIADGVLVMKRPSGGEAVLVSSNTIVISFCLIGVWLMPSRDAFALALQSMITSLARCGISQVQHKGISDLVLNGKKILGCAIYRRPGMLIYHAVLNVSESPTLIARYLKHPVREPDYRKQRSHSDFVTSLTLEGHQLDFEQFKTEFQSILIGQWQESLRKDYVKKAETEVSACHDNK